MTKGKVGIAWQQAPLKRKIEYFLASVVLIILASVIFDVWIAKYSLFDFYNILEENNKVNELVLAMENEESQFKAYVREDYHSDEETDAFYQTVNRSRSAIWSLPSDYSSIGAERYARTWAIKNAFEVYETARDEVLNMSEETPRYVEHLYEVYDMQSYLIAYSRDLMNLTLKAGDAAYSNTLPNLLIVPFVIIVVALVLTFASVSLVTMVNKSLVHPIDELVKASKKIAGNEFFIDDVVIDNKDEMGELASAFNQMKFATGEYINALEDKRQTLDRLHEEELSRLEIERQVQNMKFDVLKNQINPHFLFNTLNVISGMAKLEGAATTDKMINALSSLFRYNLKTQSPMVSLSQEIKVVNDYMYLQQMRFGDRITYEINCSDEAALEMIPPFTLQPLVENSIIHGLSVKEEGGHISIEVEKKDEFLVIVVQDTGAGMDDEELKELMKEWDKGTGKYKGIGLGNIKRRIENFYKDGNVSVTSVKGQGTAITIEIPCTKEKD